MTMRPDPTRRGSVIIIVLWAIAIAALVTSSVQLMSYRQATIGREALGRVQARWAARAGIEETISVMAYHIQYPDSTNAFAMAAEMELVATGEMPDATWDILHHADDVNWFGPMDEHSKFNINFDNEDTVRNTLMALEDMTSDLVDPILDWLDEDEEPRTEGAEADWYSNYSLHYKPRDAPMRHIVELELVAGIWTDYFRGEDWNLNNRLDPNEDDGSLLIPEDEPDEVMDARWSAMLTAQSVRGGGPTESGEPWLMLAEAEPAEIEERLGLEPELAESLSQWAQGNGAQLEQLFGSIVTPQSRREASRSGSSGGSRTSTNTSSTTTSGAVESSGAPGLTIDEVRAVYAEATIETVTNRLPGKLNINTVSEDLLRLIYPDDQTLVDEIIYRRDPRSGGIVNIVDLMEIRGVTPEIMEQIASMMDTHSNVYTITSRGRSSTTGVEVEIVAVVDRSTLPIKILEYREQ